MDRYSLSAVAIGCIGLVFTLAWWAFVVCVIGHFAFGWFA